MVQAETHTVTTHEPSIICVCLLDALSCVPYVHMACPDDDETQMLGCAVNAAVHVESMSRPPASHCCRHPATRLPLPPSTCLPLPPSTRLPLLLPPTQTARTIASLCKYIPLNASHLIFHR